MSAEQSALLDDLLLALATAIARELPGVLLLAADLELEVHPFATEAMGRAASEGPTALRVVDSAPGAPRRPQG